MPLRNTEASHSLSGTGDWAAVALALIEFARDDPWTFLLTIPTSILVVGYGLRWIYVPLVQKPLTRNRQEYMMAREARRQAAKRMPRSRSNDGRQE